MNRELIKEVRSARVSLGFAVALGLLAAAATILQVVALSKVVDGVFLEGADLGEARGLLLLLLCAFVLRSVVGAGGRGPAGGRAGEVRAEGEVVCAHPAAGAVLHEGGAHGRAHHDGDRWHREARRLRRTLPATGLSQRARSAYDRRVHPASGSFERHPLDSNSPGYSGPDGPRRQLC